MLLLCCWHLFRFILSEYMLTGWYICLKLTSWTGTFAFLHSFQHQATADNLSLCWFQIRNRKILSFPGQHVFKDGWLTNHGLQPSETFVALDNCWQLLPIGLCWSQIRDSREKEDNPQTYCHHLNSMASRRWKTSWRSSRLPRGGSLTVPVSTTSRKSIKWFPWCSQRLATLAYRRRCLSVKRNDQDTHLSLAQKRLTCLQREANHKGSAGNVFSFAQ